MTNCAPAVPSSHDRPQNEQSHCEHLRSWILEVVALVVDAFKPGLLEDFLVPFNGAHVHMLFLDVLSTCVYGGCLFHEHQAWNHVISLFQFPKIFLALRKERNAILLDQVAKTPGGEHGVILIRKLELLHSFAVIRFNSVSVPLLWNLTKFRLCLV